MVTHARLGLWLGGSLLVHALAVQLFDLPVGKTHPSRGDLRVTLLDASSHDTGATSATAVPPILSPERNPASTPMQSEQLVEQAPPVTVKAVAVDSVLADPPLEVDKPTMVTAASSAVVNAETKRPSKVRSRDKERRGISTTTIDAVAESAPVLTRPRAEANPLTPQTAERPAFTAEPRTSKEAAQADQPPQAAGKAAPTSLASVASGPNAVHSSGTARIAERDSNNDGAADAGAAASAQANAQAGDHAAFLKLLHAAIDGHKRYPSMARRLRREGVATVLFRLHPDGDIDALAVADSSGFAVLDAAALRAVAAVAPFAPATTFLTREARFRVGVKFHLY